ncbi:MAG TPA: winged helix-turn-helix domain-containing protein [Vicinamibacterales bacterium]|nr:winged helix-turn-helix domain-containing protein [Vicinamibacterales bacterium]
MIHTFGTFSFDSRSSELTRQGRRVPLEPQPARALARLLADAGELVTRDELRAAIWGAETHVDYDRGLAYCIGQVRTALGDSGDNPRFVETLPRRGFRFVAPVAPAETGPVAPTSAAPRAARWILAAIFALALVGGAWWWGVARPAAPVTVAVSIFDNETGDAGLDAFVTGLSDVVVTHLAGLAPGQVGVIGNAAPLRQPRNIRNLTALAAALDADYVVLGQLQRQGEDLRFIVHLIRLADGVHLSAERFIRPPGEVARFETDVVAGVERAVRTVAPMPSGS